MSRKCTPGRRRATPAQARTNFSGAFWAATRATVATRGVPGGRPNRDRRSPQSPPAAGGGSSSMPLGMIATRASGTNLRATARSPSVAETATKRAVRGPSTRSKATAGAEVIRPLGV